MLLSQTDISMSIVHDLLEVDPHISLVVNVLVYSPVKEFLKCF